MHSSKRPHFPAFSPVLCGSMTKSWTTRQTDASVLCGTSKEASLNKLSQIEASFCPPGLSILLASYIDMRAGAVEAIFKHKYRKLTLWVAEQKNKHVDP